MGSMIRHKQNQKLELHEIKILDVPLNKTRDQIAITFTHLTAEPTKQGILKKFASRFDPVGLAPLILLT